MGNCISFRRPIQISDTQYKNGQIRFQWTTNFSKRKKKLRDSSGSIWNYSDTKDEKDEAIIQKLLYKESMSAEKKTNQTTTAQPVPTNLNFTSD